MKRYTVPQTAIRLRRGPEMVREWLRQGRIRGEKIGAGKGGIWLISERELARFQRAEPRRRRPKGGS